jgi:hypothetical protein
MTQRITNDNVYQAAHSLHRALIILGIVESGTTLMVQEGNSTYGHSWELRTRNEDGYVKLLPGINLHGYQTKREAYDHICAASYLAWELINSRSKDQK